MPKTMESTPIKKSQPFSICTLSWSKNHCFQTSYGGPKHGLLGKVYETLDGFYVQYEVEQSCNKNTIALHKKYKRILLSSVHSMIVMEMTKYQSEQLALLSSLSHMMSEE